MRPAPGAGCEPTSGLLTLGEPGQPEVEHLVEEWLIQQASLTLPDSGALVRPLTYGSFLVGLLVVERTAGATEQWNSLGRSAMGPGDGACYDTWRGERVTGAQVEIVKCGCGDGAVCVGTRM